MADLLSGFTADQLAVQSLCSEWTVRDVAAHLVMPLAVGLPKFMVTILLCGGSFDRANVRITRKLAQRPIDEIIGLLRHKATSRFTPPGAGPEAPLTDLLVHGLDIRWPLNIVREIPTETMVRSLVHLATPAANGFLPKRALHGLRLQAEDIDWHHGDGPAVIASAEVLLLAMSGRTVALEHLVGEGAATLTGRLL